MDKDQSGNAPGEDCSEASLTQAKTSMIPDSLLVRAARAKLVEETSYRLTDLFTVIHGQVQILSDKLPSVLRDELLPISKAVMKGVEYNKLMLWVAQECRREIDR